MSKSSIFWADEEETMYLMADFQREGILFSLHASYPQYL